MAKKADQCTDEYSIDDYGECWECMLPKDHVGWHICQRIEQEAVWLNGKLDGRKKVMVELRWMRGKIEKYDLHGRDGL